MSDPLALNLYKGDRTLSVMPTYSCTAACKHCGTVSSPHDRNNIDLETIVSAIDQANKLGFPNVVFTGGEATIRWDDLLEAIRHAHQLGLLTRLVTNAHWASSLEEAMRCVGELADAGLKEINYSTGDEHIRFVPLDNIAYAVVAALKHPFSPVIMIELRANRWITKQSLFDHSQISFLNSEDKDRIRVIESPWMPLRPLVIERYPDGAAINRDNISATTGCHSVLQTYVIQANGRIGACCGLGMRITPELNIGVTRGDDFLQKAIHEAESDFLKVLLRYKGPEKLLAWAASKDPEIEWENLYAHKCQACLRVYKDPKVGAVIRQHYTELITDVLQAAWIEEEFYPAIGQVLGS